MLISPLSFPGHHDCPLRRSFSRVLRRSPQLDYRSRRILPPSRGTQELGIRPFQWLVRYPELHSNQDGDLQDGRGNGSFGSASLVLPSLFIFLLLHFITMATILFLAVLSLSSERRAKNERRTNASLSLSSPFSLFPLSSLPPQHPRPILPTRALLSTTSFPFLSLPFILQNHLKRKKGTQSFCPPSLPKPCLLLSYIPTSFLGSHPQRP